MGGESFQQLISRESAGDYVACRPRGIVGPYATATGNSCVLSRKGFTWVSCSAARSFREQTLRHSRSFPTAAVTAVGQVFGQLIAINVGKQ
jgi:hypothetical protein